MKPTLLKRSFAHAAGVIAYVFAVSLLLSRGKDIFGDSEETLLIPVFMMLLLVVSATVTGLLVLGKPVMLYLNGARKDALAMLGATVGWLVAFLLTIVVAMLLT
jgi:hypothetical protein